MSKHTPEPWSIDEPHQIFAQALGEYVAVTDVEPELTLISREVQEANARRIVACVNACVGISIEALESQGEKAIHAMGQRDELLTHLKNATKDMRSHAAKIGSMHAWWDSIFDAEALIAKIEGTTDGTK